MKKAYVYVKGYTNPKVEKYTAVFVQLYFCLKYARKKYKITIFSDEVAWGVLPHSEFKKMLECIKTSKVRNVVIFPDILTVDEMCELLSLGVKANINRLLNKVYSIK